MSTSLFRQEAIDHQRFRIWGEVAIGLPNSFGLVTTFIALSVLAMALFVATHNYARKEHGSGSWLRAKESPESRRRATERLLQFTSEKVSTSSAVHRC